MRAVITGGSGFLGSWVTRAMLARGHELLVLTRSPDAWRLRGLAGANIRSTEPSAWAAEIASFAPDTLLLLDWAGVDGPSRDSPQQFENIPRQRGLIEAALTAGANRILATGSQAEYGPRLDRIPEDAPPHPVTPYGQAKVQAAEQLAELTGQAGADGVWARVFSVFGPLDNEGLLLATVADRLMADEDVALSSGEQAWSYLAAPDAGRALAVLAERGSGAVNVGHPDAPKLRDTIETFAAHFHSAGRLVFGDSPSPGASRLQPDTTRLEALGWRPEIEVPAALATTARWLRREPVDDELTGGRLPVRP